MEFKQPEVLFALFFLIIPLLVHLFQLRKFQKEDFTNVKFLKRISRQTRKSSRLKKFLVLTTRLLALACIIFAFAQPYFPAENETGTQAQKIIYLDNSFSMQAPGTAGELLNAAVQDLLKNLPEDETFSFFTNNATFDEISTEELKDQLQEIEYSDEILDFNGINLNAARLGSKEGQKEVILISDFQQNLEIPASLRENSLNYIFVNQQPQEFVNLSIDSLYIAGQNPENIQLQFYLSGNTAQQEPISVAVYDGEELLARQTVELNDNFEAEGTFQLPNIEIAEGKIEIEDNALYYDNSLFFSLNPPEGIQGMVIESEGADSAFLSRIFSEPDFNLEIFPLENVDYNKLSKASFVILNKPENISPTLTSALKKITSEGGIITIIPPVKSHNLNPFLQNINGPVLGENIDQERLITNIAFEHPLLENVFEKRVQNFEYPRVQNFYNVQASGNNVLGFQDNSAFLTEKDNIFLFTAALNDENSNFKNSPLVVPVFYNIGLSAVSLPQLYYETGKENEIDIPAENRGDEVVSLRQGEESFIPLQQSFPGRVRITTSDLPDRAGNYQVIFNEEQLGNLSFNYHRRENLFQNQDVENIENVEIYNSVSDYFEATEAASQHTLLWKSFVIFALIFLMTEMLLLKYLK